MSHDDDELGRRLRADIDRMVGDAGESAPPPLGVQPRQARSRGVRWLPLLSAAAAAVVLIGGLVLIANRDNDETPVATPIDSTPIDTVPDGSTPTTTPSTSTPGTTAVTVVPTDQLYESIASVIDDGNGARLCFSVLESLPPQCGGGIALAGWDWDAIDVEQSQNGIAWVDQIYVAGTYDPASQTMTVSEVRLPTDADRERLVVFPTPDFSVPCPEPEEGWPARRQEWPGEQVAAIEGYAGAWVDESQQVMTVKFTGDLEAAEAALREVYSGAVCVVPAEHGEAELRAIQDQLMQLSSIQILSTSLQVDAAGESVLAEIIAPDPERQAAFDAEFGPGVVRLISPLRLVESGSAP